MEVESININDMPQVLRRNINSIFVDGRIVVVMDERS